MLLLPIYNLCPTQNSPVLRLVDGVRQFEPMRWQLVPATECALTTKLSTINARSESVFDSGLYRNLVIRHRCIVPISGFFEWKRNGQRSQPFKIHLRNEAIMSVAGIWETWRKGTPEEQRSFSILTTAANEFMREIHDRMPGNHRSLGRRCMARSENDEKESLQLLLKPCPSSWLTAVEVSPLVNSPKNNVPEVLQPAVAMEHSQQGVLRFD